MPKGAENLAGACAAAGIPLVTFSSDLVFDGRLGRPMSRRTGDRPTSVYGESKAEAERRVLAAVGKRAGHPHQPPSSGRGTDTISPGRC